MQEVFAGVKISTIFVQIKGTFKFDTPYFFGVYLSAGKGYAAL